MANNYFKFKQFTVLQNNAAMKVGTDGVLLGAWANCQKANRILDIGTGTGLIALMLAQRCNAQIDAIDIEVGAVTDARLNAENSPWSERINIHHASIKEFVEKTTEKYDLIVSNPPFFINSLKAENQERTTARHTYTLDASDLFLSVTKLLVKSGIFSVVIPTDNFELYQQLAQKHLLYCNKILWVKPTPAKAAKRVLLEFSFFDTKASENTLTVEKYGRHKYSEEYIELTKDFYLNF